MFGRTPVMHAVNHEYRLYEYRCLKSLAADPRVDLDTTDANGWSLEDLARSRLEIHCCDDACPDECDADYQRICRKMWIIDEGKRRRLIIIREQKRQVSKVLLDGL